MVSQACGLLWADMGMGKTSITLKYLKVLLDAGQIQRALVVAPVRPAELTWPDEAGKWDFAEGLDLVVLRGKDRDRLLEEGHAVCVVNPEGLEWLFRIAEVRRPVKVRDPRTGEVTEKLKTFVVHDMRWARSLGFDCLVVDESTMYKHTNSRRFKVLKPLLPLFKRRWALTAKPSPNGYEDLFGQAYVADEGRSLGQYVTGFRREFFTPGGWGGYTWEIQETGEERILERLKPLVMRLDNPEYRKEVPPVFDHVVEVVLPPKAEKAYREMERHMVTELSGKTFTAVSAGVASMKCRQLAAGAIIKQADLADAPLLRKGEYEVVHTEKVAAVREIADSLQGRPLLVGFNFTAELEMLRKEFGKDLPAIAGGTTQKQAAAIIAEWNRGRIPVLAGHPRAMGHGLNMQEACQHIAWMSPTWDLELYEQFLGRVARGGNPHDRVFNHIIIARGTVEEEVYAAALGKGTVQERLLAAFAKYRGRSLTQGKGIATKR